MTEIADALADQGLVTFPVPRSGPFDLPAEYARLRAESPVARVRTLGGGTAWLVTRHADVCAILGDPRLSSDRRNPGFPRLVPDFQRTVSVLRPALITLDPPEHTIARRAIAGEFTVRQVEAHRPRVQQIVDECVDHILAMPGPVDLVREFALPVPSLVICELLGVPYADHGFFQARSTAMVSRSTAPADRLIAVTEMQSYLDDLITTKERFPTDDLFSRQIVKRRGSGDYDHGEMVSLAVLLLLAGHETTADMIALSVLALLANPDQLAAIVDDPAKTPMAVEELLRFFSIVEGVTSRTALADIDIGGVRIAAGEGVIALGPAANRDPEVFDSADRLDVERGARNHVAFGFGPHQCLGQNLARMELQVALDTLFRRIPGLRLAAEVDSLPFKSEASIYGLSELPVSW